MAVDLKFNIDVQNAKVLPEIVARVEKGIQESGNMLGSRMEREAIERLQRAGAIWTGELVGSFDAGVNRIGNQLIVILENDAEHARPIEYGATYEDEGPPVAALIPWVETKMSWWDPAEMADRYAPVDTESVRKQAKEESRTERLDAFTMSASEDTIRKAFFLQQHIKETGIDAVRYMKEAQDLMERHGSEMVAGQISKEIRKL